MRVPFPFSLKFKKEVDYDCFSNKQVERIKNILEERTVDILSKSSAMIEFDVSLFRSTWNTNIMGPVDHGEVRLESRFEKTILVYEISLVRLFLLGLGLSALAGLFSKSFKSFAFVFIVLVGLNWLVAFVRHKLYFDGMNRELENVLQQRTELKNN